MKIGELADLTGASIRSLRYYQQQGLITSERTAGGHRVFTEDVVDRVLVIRRLYAAGLTSSSVAVLIQCEDTGRVTPDMMDEVRGRQSEIGKRIAELSAAHDQLGRILASLDSTVDEPHR